MDEFVEQVAQASTGRMPAVVTAFAELLSHSWPRPSVADELLQLTMQDRPRFVVRRLLSILELVQLVHPTAMFFWKDEGSRFLGFCSRLADVSGLTPLELLLRTDDDPQVEWHRQGARYRKDDREILADGRARFDIVERQDRGGPNAEVVWLRTSKVPYRAAGLRGIVGGFDTIGAAEAQRLSGRR